MISANIIRRSCFFSSAIEEMALLLFAAFSMSRAGLGCRGAVLATQLNAASAFSVARAPHAISFAAPKDPNDRCLLIDGNNLMATRKVTKGRDELAAKLAGIRGYREVVLIFDGRRGEKASSSGSDPRVVITRGAAEDAAASRETADTWIARELASEAHARVEVVTADRNLRRVARDARAQCINPAKFWRRYLPRLRGDKNDYSNAPADGGE